MADPAFGTPEEQKEAADSSPLSPNSPYTALTQPTPNVPNKAPANSEKPARAGLSDDDDPWGNFKSGFDEGRAQIIPAVQSSPLARTLLPWTPKPAEPDNRSAVDPNSLRLPDDQGGSVGPSSVAHAYAGGGGSAPGPSDIEKRIGADYDEGLAGLKDEGLAKKELSDKEAEGYGRLATQDKQFADQSGKAALQTANTARDWRAQIYQNMVDYHNAKVDPEKFWHDKTAPQRIATIIGAALTSVNHPELASKQISEQIDRSIALQNDAIGRKKEMIGHNTNLLNSYLGSSHSYQEALDKTRATLHDAAMSEIMQAKAAAQTPVQQAQYRQLYAAERLKRDTVMGKLEADRMHAYASAQAAANAPQGELQVDGEQIVTDPTTGEQYVINNKTEGKSLTERLQANDRLRRNIAEGNAILNERQLSDYPGGVLGINKNFQRGEALDADNAIAVAKIAGARGLPPNLEKKLHDSMTQYGSLTGEARRAKGEEMLKVLEQYKAADMAASGARPAQIRQGPAGGKKGSEMVNFATLGPRTVPGKVQEAKKEYSGFTPDK